MFCMISQGEAEENAFAGTDGPRNIWKVRGYSYPPLERAISCHSPSLLQIVRVVLPLMRQQYGSVVSGYLVYWILSLIGAIFYNKNYVLDHDEDGYKETWIDI
jgi:hypothetical protein